MTWARGGRRLLCSAPQIFVFFPDEAKVGVKTIKTYAERMRNEGVFRAIMVTQVRLVRAESHTV